LPHYDISKNTTRPASKGIVNSKKIMKTIVAVLFILSNSCLALSNSFIILNNADTVYLSEEITLNESGILNVVDTTSHDTIAILNISILKEKDSIVIETKKNNAEIYYEEKELTSASVSLGKDNFEEYRIKAQNEIAIVTLCFNKEFSKTDLFIIPLVRHLFYDKKTISIKKT